MPITDNQMDNVVLVWRAYAEGRPDVITPADLLKKRDLKMYRGLGIVNAQDLAHRLVEDRSVATLEMTMGYLYERLLQELATDRVAAGQRQLPGYHGVDFFNRTAAALQVINLKAGLSTSNGDITGATIRNLLAARDYWQANPEGADDNPLQQQQRVIVMVRAVARGPRKNQVTDDGILWLVGESMWEYFGAGPNFQGRVSAALGRHPLNYQNYEAAKARATVRVVNYLTRANLVHPDGTLNWERINAIYD